MILLKIGGSVLTDKARANAIRKDRLHLVARQIAQARRADLVLVHGAGSFGHPQAAKYLSEGISVSGLWKIHQAVSLLNTSFINKLHSEGVPALPIHPLDNVALDAGRIVHFDATALDLMLQNSITPVLHGDIATDRTDGFNIVSGDQIIRFLALKMRPEKIGIGTDVDGVLYKGEKISRLNAIDFEKYQREIMGSSKIDVTGGMFRKVSELLEIAKSGIQSEIFNATHDGNVAKFLTSHQSIGTIISM